MRRAGRRSEKQMRRSAWSAGILRKALGPVVPPPDDALLIVLSWQSGPRTGLYTLSNQTPLAHANFLTSPPLRLNLKIYPLPAARARWRLLRSTAGDKASAASVTINRRETPDKTAPL